MRRGLSGLGAWGVQRLSAVYMVIYTPLLLAVLFTASGGGFKAWHGAFASLPMVLATALFFLLLLGHAWVGVRDVILDYVRPALLRVALLVILGLWLAALGIWLVVVISGMVA